MKLSDLLELIKDKTTKTPDWDDPDFLSDLLLELASYYSTLGEFVANAEKDADYAETHYKVTEAQATLEGINEKKAVSRAELEARVATREVKENHTEKKHKARLLFLTRQNLDKTMDAIRSRLSYLKSDKEGSRHAV